MYISIKMNSGFLAFVTVLRLSPHLTCCITALGRYNRDWGHPSSADNHSSLGVRLFTEGNRKRGGSAMSPFPPYSSVFSSRKEELGQDSQQAKAVSLRSPKPGGGWAGVFCVGFRKKSQSYGGQGGVNSCQRQGTDRVGQGCLLQGKNPICHACSVWDNEKACTEHRTHFLCNSTIIMISCFFQHKQYNNIQYMLFCNLLPKYKQTCVLMVIVMMPEHSPL